MSESSKEPVLLFLNPSIEDDEGLLSAMLPISDCHDPMDPPIEFLIIGAKCAARSL
jgi:hypothetical protein